MSIINDFINNLASAIHSKREEEEQKKKERDKQRSQFSTLEFKKSTDQPSQVVRADQLKPDLMPKASAPSAQLTKPAQAQTYQKQQELMDRVGTFTRQNLIQMPAVANAAFDTIAPRAKAVGDFVGGLMEKTGIPGYAREAAKRPDITPVGLTGYAFQGKPFTVGQETDFAKGLATDFVRAIPRGINSIVQTAAGNDTFTPKTPAEKFVYGEEPVKSIPEKAKDIHKFEKKYGAPDAIANLTALPLAAGLTISDAVPFLPEKKAGQKLLQEAAEQAVKKGLIKDVEKTAILDAGKEIEPLISKALNHIDEALKLRKEAPEAAAAEDVLSKGIKVKADYDQYIMDVNKWIGDKINSLFPSGEKQLYEFGIPNDFASSADSAGAFRTSIKSEAGSVPASTNFSPSQTSINGGLPSDAVTRNTLSSNRTNFLSSFMDTNPSQEQYTTYFRTMQEQEPHFLRQLDTVAQDLGGDVAYRMKTQESLMRKMGVKQRPLGDMNDTLAATITVKDQSEVERAIESARKNLNITKVDDYRQHPTFFGYKAVHLDHELPNGAIAEVQINTKAGLEGKQWAHDIYDKWRQYIKNNGSTTIADVVKLLGDNPQKIKEFYQDVQLSRDIYDGKVAVPSKYMDQVVEQLATTRGKIDQATGRVGQSLADLPLTEGQAVKGAVKNSIEGLPLTPPAGSSGGGGVPPGAGDMDVTSKLTYDEAAGKIFKTEKPNKFQYDVKTLATPEEVKDTILKSAQGAQDSGVLQTQRRGTLTETTIRQMADNLGMSYEDVVKRKPGQIFNAEQADAANRIMLDVNEKLFEISDNIRQLSAKGEAIPEELAAQQLEYAARAQGITAAVIGDRSEAGRALKAAQMIKEALESNKDSRTKLIEEATKIFAGDKKKAKEVIRKLSEFEPEDKVGMMKFLRKVKPSTTIDKIEEYWYNSILSNPSTHIFNTVGNTVSTLIDIPERAISGGIDAVLSGISGKQRERYIAEAGAEVAGLGSGVANGFRRAMKVMAHGISEADVNKLEVGSQAIKGPIGAVVNIPSRALVAEDEFFKGINYEMEIRAHALRAAKQEGKTGEELTRRYAELVAEPTAQIMEAATEVAKQKLFQGESVSADAVRYFRDNLFKFSAGPLGEIRPIKFIIPFVQTPINVLKFGLQHSPAGFIGAFGKAVGGGTKGEVADIMAKAFVGTAAMIPLAVYATQDRLTGPAPTDKKLQDAFYAEGKLPWAIKIGNDWVAYNRVEPLNTILSQIALWHDAAKNNKEMLSLETLSNFLKAEGKNFSDQTFMTGIGNLVNAMEDPERFGQKFITDILGGFIPSFVASGARMTDNVVRQPKTFKDSFLARLPMYSKDVPGQESAFEEGGYAIRHTNEGKVRNFVSNVVGLRTSPDQGKDLLKDLENIKQLRADARADSEKDTETADKIFQELKGAGDPQQVIEQRIKDGTLTKSVLTKLKNNIKEAALPPLVDEEKSLKGAPIKVRAGYMVSKLQDMNPDDQEKWIGDMIQKKIVTGAVMEEYIRLKQERGLENLPLTSP